MSDAEADGAASRDDVWVEKYRPRGLDDVAGHETITERVKQYVADDDLPNLLFAGPAGVGKCVTGETPVLTSRGLEHAEEVVGDVDGFADPDDDLEVLTFDGGDVRYVAPSAVFGKRADETVTVQTRDGNESTTTPEHRFLVATKSGLEWQEAAALSPGDRIARPLTAPTPPDDADIDWLNDLDGDRIHVHLTEEFAEQYDVPVEERLVGGKKDVVRDVREGRFSAGIAEESDLSAKTVEEYCRTASDLNLEATPAECSLGHLLQLEADESELREHVTSIQYVTTANRRAAPVSPVWECSPELAEFVGLAISEAHIEAARIKFYNTDENLLDRFQHLAKSLFDVDTRRGKQSGVEYVSVQSKTLVYFLDRSFDVLGLDESDGIASTLLAAPSEAQSAFLRAMFDAEAYVSEHGIVELTQKDESYITLLTYLLASFGIPSRRSVEQKAATNGSGVEREYHTLAISGARHLQRFSDQIGFSIEEKVERLDRWAGDTTNPNHDTIPVQDAVDDLCEALYLPKGELRTDTLDPSTPGRVSYLHDVNSILDAATRRIEAAQEVLSTVTKLRADVRGISSVPTRWIGHRAGLEPTEVRRELEPEVGARSDYLLQYARGEFTPRSNRATAILEEIDALDDTPPVERVQETLVESIERLDVPYEHVAHGTEYRGTDVINLLERDDLALESLTRFETVADRVIDVASGMLQTEVVEALRTLEVLARGTLYFDEVEAVERSGDPQRVYDLTVPETHNYVAGDVPTVVHNTTTALAIAREIYGESWDEHFLELNASDQRGIDVVRGRIKDFARSSFGDVDFRIIFLDEADALTSDAQSALRRTMEQFSGNTRFVLSCNYSSRIIDPIQSRCAVFRFPPLSDDAVIGQAQRVADAEGVEVSESGLEALAYVADGDMRRAINALQAAATTADVVDEDAVYEITSSARPEEVLEMVEYAIDGDFLKARAALEDLLIDRGIAGGDVIDQLHRSVWDLEIEEDAAVRLMDRVGEAEFRIVEGADERIQLEAMLASLALEE